MSMYKQDPNNSNKQIPKSPDLSETFNEATTPAAVTIQERPNQVIISTEGSYKFLYNTTASNGGTSTAETYSSGSVIGEDNGSVTLNIQPVAWDTSDRAPVTGNVTFIYKRIR